MPGTPLCTHKGAHTSAILAIIMTSEQTPQPLTRRQRRELERAHEAVANLSRDTQTSMEAVAAAEEEARQAAAGEHREAKTSGQTGESGVSTESAGSGQAPREEASAAERAASAGVMEDALAAAEMGGTEPGAGGAHLDEPAPVTGAQRAIGATLGRQRPRGYAGIALGIVAALAVILVPLGITWARGNTTPEEITAPSAIPATTIPADAPLDTALEVAGRVGSVPVLLLNGHLAVPEQVLRDVVIQGEGRAVSEGDGVLLSVSTFSGDTGENITGTATGRRLYRGTDTAGELGEVLATAITNTTEGSRIVLRAPVEKDGTRSTEVTVVDVMPTRAEGVSTTNLPADTPSVTQSEDGTIAVDTSGITAPTRGTTGVLIQGSGRQISATDTVIARYAIVEWGSNSVTASSYGWTTPPGVLDMNDTLQGLAQRLVDVSEGSRVIVTLPADQARGDGAIAVVVDVLAIVDPASLDPMNGGSPAASSSSTAVQVTPSASPSASASNSSGSN